MNISLNHNRSGLRIGSPPADDLAYNDSPLALPAASTLPGARAMLIEAADVLYDASIWHRWLFQLVSRMGLHTHYGPFFRVWQIDYYDDVCRGRREYWDALRHFLLSAGLSRGQTAEVFAAGRARYRQLHDGVRLYPHVAQTLSILARRGIALGVLSATPDTGDQLQRCLAGLGLADCFTLVLTSRDLAAAPPSREYYDAAVSRLGHDVGQTAYLGHQASELTGAKAAGLSTIAINFEANVRADVHLTRIDDLLHVVAPPAQQALAG